MINTEKKALKWELEVEEEEGTSVETSRIFSASSSREEAAVEVVEVEAAVEAVASTSNFISTSGMASEVEVDSMILEVLAVVAAAAAVANKNNKSNNNKKPHKKLSLRILMSTNWTWEAFPNFSEGRKSGSSSSSKMMTIQ